MDIRVIYLGILMLIFTLAGVILLVENIDENLEAAIPLFVPAAAAFGGCLYLQFVIKDEYQAPGSGGPMSMRFDRMLSGRFGRKAVDSEMGMSKGGRSRYDDGGGSRYNDERTNYEEPRRKKKRTQRDDRSRYEESNYEGSRSPKGSRYGGGDSRYGGGDSRYGEDSEYGESQYEREPRRKKRPRRDRRDDY